MTGGSGSTHDVVVVGGGHNGLAAAAYLARAGLGVVLLERRDDPGGAAVSAQAFEGVDARLSRYSYLVSLLPQRVVDDLRLRIRLAPRRYSSYTPLPGDPARGLLVDDADPDATAASFARVGAASDADGFRDLYADTGRAARALWPTMTEPLPTRSEARRLVADDALWSALAEHPIGAFLERHLSSDIARGVALTDALIGTFASAGDPSLAQNVCFLYHVIGGGTGEWAVPVGGMGAVSGELARAARDAGARIVTGAEVVGVAPDGEVRYRRGGHERVIAGRQVLANVAPAELARLLGDASPPAAEGAQVKTNLLLRRLPRLRDETVAPEAAFGGTFHVNEGYSQLESAFRGALRGRMPEPMPLEVYCHSLADPSILEPGLAASGAHTLTAFGLHTPDRWLSDDNNAATRERLQGGDARLARLGARRADRGPASHGCRGPTVHRDEDHARPRARPPSAGWQHLPRAADLAVRRRRRAARIVGRALGRRDGAPAHSPLRRGRSSGRRGQRPRRPERRDGSARAARGLIRPYAAPRMLPGGCHAAHRTSIAPPLTLGGRNAPDRGAHDERTPVDESIRGAADRGADGETAGPTVEAAERFRAPVTDERILAPAPVEPTSAHIDDVTSVNSGTRGAADDTRPWMTRTRGRLAMGVAASIAALGLAFGGGAAVGAGVAGSSGTSGTQATGGQFGGPPGQTGTTGGSGTSGGTGTGTGQTGTPPNGAPPSGGTGTGSSGTGTGSTSGSGTSGTGASGTGS